MNYLYDVWVNWFESEEQGYNVCPYHEWRKKDRIEVLEQVPLLYIEESLFHHLENSLYELPEALLKTIVNRSYKRKGLERKLLDYVCVVTDGRGILAIDTGGFQIPLRKSRLIPRQEQQVYALCKKMKQQVFTFDMPETDEETGAIPAECMVGLTRKERQLKTILLMALEPLKHSHDRNELLYWYAEWDHTKLWSGLYQQSIEKLWQSLYEDIRDGWSEAHAQLCRQLIKGQPYLEKMWEKEQAHPNSSYK